jgi:glycine/serine hydroxymethyltransferase
MISNQDIRAKILQDLYYRKQNGMEILQDPQEYAKLLGISNELTNFNIQYLAEAGLVQGMPIVSTGTTKKHWLVMDLTSYGIEAVEGRRGQDLAVNFSIINVNAPVTQSQIAAGQHILQTQSSEMKTFDDIEQYVDQKISGPDRETLKTELQELRGQVDRDEVKPTTLQRIREIAERWGPVGLVVFEAVMKLLSGGP